jgi:hypothetical protein
MGNGTFIAIQRISSFFFLSAIIFGVSTAKSHPTAIFVLSVLAIAIGLLLFIYGLLNIQRYKDVFDYEPAQFWGRESNGKHARQVLTFFAVMGLWCLFTGTTLAIIIFIFIW